MNARLYDPTLGRFITPDSFVEAAFGQGLNRYTYVLNSPLSLTDPSGFCGEGEGAGDAGDAGGGAEGGFSAITSWIQSSFNSLFSTGMQNSNLGSSLTPNQTTGSVLNPYTNQDQLISSNSAGYPMTQGSTSTSLFLIDGSSIADQTESRGPYILNFWRGAERNRNFLSAGDGTVESIRWERLNDHDYGFGYFLRVRSDSSNTVFTYAHVDPKSVTVAEGESVTRGKLLGQYADPKNGGATGPHLHFEWRNAGDNRRLDPASYKSVVMPGYLQQDNIHYRDVHPVSGDARWHNGYDLVGPMVQNRLKPNFLDFLR